MSNPALLSEITAGPLASQIAPFIAAGNDAAINALLTATTSTALGWVPVSTGNLWAAQYPAELANLVAISQNAASPFYGFAFAFLNGLKGIYPDGVINLGSSAVMTAINNWPFVDTTGAAKSALIAAGTLPASRESITGLDCSIQSIANALRG